MLRFRLLALMLFCLLGLAPGLPAQSAPAATTASPAKPTAATVPAPEETSETQEQLAANVDNLGKALNALQKRVDTVTAPEGQLGTLADEVAPEVGKAQALVDRLTPRTAAMKARVDQLGPKPDTTKPENAEIAAQRQTLEKAYTSNDDLLRRAKSLLVQAQQLQNYIAKRKRDLFTQSLFQRSDSILSPGLWLTIAADMPSYSRAVMRIFDDWLSSFNRNVSGSSLVIFWGAVFAVMVLYLPLTLVLKRVLPRSAGEVTPNVWNKALAACWTSVSIAGAIIAIMYGVVYVFSFGAGSSEALAPLFATLQLGIVRIALALGLARGLLAPTRSKWRLVNLDDKTCEKLTRIIIAVAIIVSVGKVIEAVNAVVIAPVQFSIAVRGIGALTVSGALALALFDLGDDPEASNPDADAEAKPPVQRREWYGIIRGGLFALILAIAAAVVVGYSPFASFLVDEALLVAVTFAILFLLVRLIEKACELGFKPNAFVGRTLVYTVGIRRETLGQFAILLAGLARLTLLTFALVVVVAPLGMQSTDYAANLHALFFGFKIGDVTISLEGIIGSIITFLLVMMATRAVQNWLEKRFLPQTRLDAGLRNSIKMSLGYSGFIVALSLAAVNIGLDFQKLAFVAGALSVGIGFGLQSIVSNFVSGLILLWERAVRVGDWIVVGSDQGYVRRINVRSTEIETFDRASVIVPNSNLISGVVKNLMRTDNVGRLTIEISAHISADPEKVREILLAIARANESVLSLPAPQVRFMNLTSSQITFNLFCFVADVEHSLRTKSDLYFEICKQFRAHKFFEGPAADPMGINIVGLDRLESILTASRPAEIEPPLRSRMTG